MYILCMLIYNRWFVNRVACTIRYRGLDGECAPQFGNLGNLLGQRIETIPPRIQPRRSGGNDPLPGLFQSKLDLSMPLIGPSHHSAALQNLVAIGA